MYRIIEKARLRFLIRAGGLDEELPDEEDDEFAAFSVGKRSCLDELRPTRIYMYDNVSCRNVVLLVHTKVPAAAGACVSILQWCCVQTGTQEVIKCKKA